MQRDTELRRTDVHRNLDYQFKFFGLDLFDLLVVGVAALSVSILCFLFNLALAWGLPVFVSGLLAMRAIRAGAPPEDLIIKIRASISPRHLSILGPDTAVLPFKVSERDLRRTPHV